MVGSAVGAWTGTSASSSSCPATWRPQSWHSDTSDHPCSHTPDWQSPQDHPVSFLSFFFSFFKQLSACTVYWLIGEYHTLAKPGYMHNLILQWMSVFWCISVSDSVSFTSPLWQLNLTCFINFCQRGLKSPTAGFKRTDKDTKQKI